MTRTSLLRTLKIAAAVIVVLGVLAYALWRSLDYGRGPSIIVEEPSDWSSTSTSTIVVRGRIERANFISLNGSPLAIDERGNWSNTIVLFPGTNITTLEARDRFDRTVRLDVHIYRQDLR